MKKRPITLIEVVIFCSLAAIVLGAILYFFAQTIRVDTKIQNVKKEIYLKQHLELKLHNIFSRLLPSSAMTNDIQKSSFFTHKEKSKKSPSLYFYFESGVDPSTEFSGSLFGLLILEYDEELKSKVLALKIWPSSFDKDTVSLPTRRHVLLEKVQEINFEFYTKNEKTNKLEKESLWPEENKKMPLMFLLKVKRELDIKEKVGKKEEISFPFFITSEENVVIYDEKKKP